MNRSLSFIVALGFLGACDPNTKSGFDIVITGESAATQGFAYPPLDESDPHFQDGWALTFTHVIAYVGDIALAENPDRSAGDQSQTGPPVARVDGPFVVDLAQPGPAAAREQNGTTWPVTSVEATFDATQKYAFGYALKTATAGATKVNAIDDALLATMVANQWALWFHGVAEFKGTDCRASDSGYDFNRIPKRVRFSLGYRVPTNYLNCVNPELRPDNSRGVQTLAGQKATAQITFHLDHPFWEALQENAPLRFDLIAARTSVAVGAVAPAEASLTQEHLVGLDFQAGRDAQGLLLPWRTCTASMSGEHTTGAVSYDPKGVPVSAQGGAAGLKDLAEYMAYNLSTFGHLNNDGLCYPVRDFPSPR